MRINRSRLSLAVPAALLLPLLALLVTGCEADTPQNTFAADGEVARDQRDLFYLAMWPAIGVMVLVELGLVVILLRFRRRREDEVPAQVHGNTRLELAWTIAPALLMLVLAVPMMSLLFKLGREPHDDAFVVNVTGVQWQWLYEYPDIEGSDGESLKSAPGDPLVFPAGREIRFNLTSVDVIHSFWIPRLGGKLDAVPSRDNRFWLKADEPGTWSGQCAEFCGLDHANMKLVAEALSEEDFSAWVDEKLAGTKTSSDAAGAIPAPAP
jgi:cytochrome c oxidase subunit 2